MLKWIKSLKNKRRSSRTSAEKGSFRKDSTGHFRSASSAARKFTKDKSVSNKAVILSRSQHGISRKKIDKHALKVLYRLHKAGYHACLVGGAVRDLLLGVTPKDFDVATDATPEQVNKLFRNCRLIGRRFRLAHIHFGRQIIEVATFRAEHENHSGDQSGHLDESGRRRGTHARDDGL